MTGELVELAPVKAAQAELDRKLEAIAEQFPSVCFPEDEQELEAIMVPAMRSEEYDDRIMRWTEVPRLVVSGVCLGVVLAFGVHYLIR